MDTDIITSSWEGKKNLPFFLRDSYDFSQATLLGYKYLIMIDTTETEQPPAIIKKHIAKLKNEWDGDVIYVREQITAYNRNRLIKNKIPFVVPKNQLYLPMLAIDLREHFVIKQTSSNNLSPATQLLVLYSIYKKRNLFNNTTHTEWAQELNYTKMTMTRAFRELRNILGNDAHIGKIQGKALWNRIKPYLITPVRGRYYYAVKLPNTFKTILAGDSGLAHYTKLVAPNHKIICMGSKRWKYLKENFAPVELDCPEPDIFEVEVWKYMPDKLMRNGIPNTKICVYFPRLIWVKGHK